MTSESIDKDKELREIFFQEGEEIEGTPIKGYDFNQGVDYDKLLDTYYGTGFQASQFGSAIKIINKMISEKAKIYLGYTSNMGSSGIRDIIRYLVEHKMVDVLVTTAGGIEEDIMKCFGDFVLGSFDADGGMLREKVINRIGNIFVPNSRYTKFEDFNIPLLEEIYKEQKETGKIITPSEFIWKLGEKVNNPESICYWAWKNKIKIYCPALTDGAIGDNIYFFKSKNPDFKLDVSDDIMEMNNSTLGIDKSGVIILGGGVAKHHIMNANMFRNGADYAVYINNASYTEGSDSGAPPEEAISWGKLMADSERVKVHGDCTIIFPLLVAKTFAKQKS